jgi:flagellar biosynthesis/type III secretory pathway chaperone
MNHLQLIKSILLGQLKGCRALLELLQKEKECLIHFKTDEIEKLSKEKDTLLLKLKLYEDERIRLINDFKDANTLEDDITLERLYEMTGDEELIKLRTELRSLLQSIHELNGINRVLIERSLQYLHQTTDFFKSMGLEITPDSGLLCKEA